MLSCSNVCTGWPGATLGSQLCPIRVCPSFVMTNVVTSPVQSVFDVLSAMVMLLLLSMVVIVLIETTKVITVNTAGGISVKHVTPSRLRSFYFTLSPNKCHLSLFIFPVSSIYCFLCLSDAPLTYEVLVITISVCVIFLKLFLMSVSCLKRVFFVSLSKCLLMFYFSASLRHSMSIYINLRMCPMCPTLSRSHGSCSVVLFFMLFTRLL